MMSDEHHGKDAVSEMMCSVGGAGCESAINGK
jgi:hypothetical protein